MSMNPSGQSSTKKTAVICRLTAPRRIRIVEDPRHARGKTAEGSRPSLEPGPRCFGAALYAFEATGRILAIRGPNEWYEIYKRLLRRPQSGQSNWATHLGT